MSLIVMGMLTMLSASPWMYAMDACDQQGIAHRSLLMHVYRHTYYG